MCFKDRKASAIVVAALSVLLLLLSVGMVIVTGKFRGLIYELPKFSEPLTGVFRILLLATLLGCCCSCCGILASMCKNRLVACCFGLSLLPATVFVFGLGITTTSISMIPMSEYEALCDEPNQPARVL